MEDSIIIHIMEIMEITEMEIIAITKSDTARTVPRACMREHAHEEETAPKVQPALFVIDWNKVFIATSFKNFSLFYHGKDNL